MRISAGSAFLGGILAAVSSVAGAAEAPGAPKIVVGPNILVSLDGDVAHCETMIAANPRDSKNLLGGSITLTLPDGGRTNKSYASFDGGSTWHDRSFPEEAEQGGWDPQVGFGATGTAYFAGISLSRGIYFYRSEDGGKTWGRGVSLDKGDHEMLVADQTQGPYAGRIYVTYETDQKGSTELEDLVMRRRVVLYRSSDDGRFFIGPIEVARGDGTGLAAFNPLVLSDGTLFIPMSEYPNYSLDKEASRWKYVFSLSSDGGVTFSKRQLIAEVPFGAVKTMSSQKRSVRVDQISGPVFAVTPTGKYRDRIYAAWTELDGERLRLVLTFSSDRGKTWSKPKAVDPSAPADASQFLPMIAANPDGILGVFWYATEGRSARDRSDAFFTASLDGGERFLPRVRVSSETSHPFGGGNLRPGPIVREDRGMVTTFFVSAVSRWASGGDYIGMTADADGIFHPFWADGRSGTYQLYTAAIRVLTEPPPPLPALEKASLAGKVTLTYDPIRYDAQTREAFLPVRLKNISKESLYPALTVEIKELVHPLSAKAGQETDVPKILNASNGKTGVGATFDYSKALGGLDSLEPGAVSNAILWRLQAESAVRTNFYVATEITGFVAKKETK